MKSYDYRDEQSAGIRYAVRDICLIAKTRNTKETGSADYFIRLNKDKLNDTMVAFHYKSYGTFLILKKPYNSTVELPTTEIIEPKKEVSIETSFLVLLSFFSLV